MGLGCGWPWDRNSVHKWEDRASRRRFGAFVYTVALLWTDVGTQPATHVKTHSGGVALTERRILRVGLTKVRILQLGRLRRVRFSVRARAQSALFREGPRLECAFP